MKKYNVMFTLRIFYPGVEAENEDAALKIADEFYMQEDLTGTLSDPDVEIEQVH